MTTRAHVTTAVHFADGVTDVMGDPQEPEAPMVYANLRGADGQHTSGRPYVAFNIGDVTFFTFNPETLDQIEHAALDAKDKLSAALAAQANAG